MKLYVPSAHLQNDSWVSRKFWIKNKSMLENGLKLANSVSIPIAPKKEKTICTLEHEEMKFDYSL